MNDVKKEGEKITENFEQSVIEPLRKQESEYTNKAYSPKNQQVSQTQPLPTEPNRKQDDSDNESDSETT